MKSLPWLKHALPALALLTLAPVSPAPAFATVVIAKDLDALCAEADRVFVGTVSAVESRWGDPWERHIETLVTFADVEPLYQVDTPEVEMRFSGGQVGDIVERVQGMPTFTVGERFVIFARHGFLVSPLVGFNQGSVAVKGDGGDATVSMPSYQHLGTASGRHLLAEVAGASTTVPLDTFIADVRQRLAARQRRP